MFQPPSKSLLSFLFHRRQFRDPSANTCYPKQCLLPLIVLVKSKWQVLYLEMGVWRTGDEVANAHLILGRHSGRPCFTLQVYTIFTNAFLLVLTLSLPSCMSLNRGHTDPCFSLSWFRIETKTVPGHLGTKCFIR